MEIPLGAASACNNVVWYEGLLRVRDGHGWFLTGPDGRPVIHIARHVDKDGSFKLLVLTGFTDSVAVWHQNPGWALLGNITTFDTSIETTSCCFAGVTYFTTGSNELYQYDGSAIATVASTQPEAKFKPSQKPHHVTAGDSRIFVAHVEKDGDTLGYREEWCDRLNPKVWQGGVGGGSSKGLDFPKNSDPITATYAAGSNVLTFRSRETFLLEFVDYPYIYDIRGYFDGVGCIAPASIRPYRNGLLVWLGDDNVYVGAPGQAPQAIGDHIIPRMRKVCYLPNMHRCFAVLRPELHLYTLYCPDFYSGAFTRIFTVNLKNGSWWEGNITSGLAPTCAVSYRVDNWTTQHLIGGQDGNIYVIGAGFLGDYPDAAFPCSFTTGVIAARNIFGPEVEQAIAQQLRVMGEVRAAGAMDHFAGFTLEAGNGLDRFQSYTFQTAGQTDQPIGNVDGLLYTCERVTAENFKVTVSSSSEGEVFPLISQIILGLMPKEGQTR